ncbi:hypothetical protein HA466_0029720 [Hirschfeldia incana]|nr:hypothetical protein HA466_0029720 [Hirschfeldia incana]
MANSFIILSGIEKQEPVSKEDTGECVIINATEIVPTRISMQTHNKVIRYDIPGSTACSVSAAGFVCFFILSIYVHVLLGGHRLSEGFF